MRTIPALVAMLLLIAACGAGGDTAAIAELEPVVLAPGAVTSGQVTIDGTSVDYAVAVPAGFEVGDRAPVLLAMPPGGQDLALTTTIVERTYAPEALARGWVVVSPAAPDGQLYFQGSELLIPTLVAWVGGWVDIEGGRPHLAGISNGGLSAFRLAANQPDGFASIVAFPGFPRNADDRSALPELTDIPIRLVVGETDSGWVTPMEETEATLEELGGDVALEILTGEGHVIASLSDGVRIFDALDAAR